MLPYCILDSRLQRGAFWDTGQHSGLADIPAPQPWLSPDAAVSWPKAVPAPVIPFA